MSPENAWPDYCVIETADPQFGPIGIGADPAQVYTVHYEDTGMKPTVEIVRAATVLQGETALINAAADVSEHSR